MFHLIFSPKEYTFTLQQFHIFTYVGSTDANPLALESSPSVICTDGI